MGCVYRIQFQNGKSYIGISNKDAKKRLATHSKDSRRGSRQLIHKAMRKYPGLFTIKEIAWSSDWAVLCKAEQMAIKVFNTKLPHGYNMTDGGDGTTGCRVSEAHKKKLSALYKGKPSSRKNFCHTEETKKKISLAGRGRKSSALSIQKTIERNKARVWKPESLEKLRVAALGNQRGKGWVPSEETRQRMRIANKEARKRKKGKES